MADILFRLAFAECFRSSCVRRHLLMDASTPPAASMKGDVQLILDEGLSFRAHNQYLQLTSDVFEDALKHCSQEQPNTAPEGAHDATVKSLPPSSCDTAALQLPLPGVSKRQLLLLLCCLYAFRCESWMGSLDPSQLLDLVTIADKFGCKAVVELVDSNLVRLCKQDACKQAKTVFQRSG